MRGLSWWACEKFAPRVYRLLYHTTPKDVPCIVHDDIRLGGVYPPELLGPTSEGLAHNMGTVPPANRPDGAGDKLPLGERQNSR
jgi:hypothetical protein